MAALASDPDAVLLSPAWSPGQARKVVLALGLAAHELALILDEPTNHFDLPSIERIERSLAAFPGGVLLGTRRAARRSPRAWRIVFSIDAAALLERSALFEPTLGAA